ncbi:hypothetical protein ACFQX8_22590 [Klenkia terrae]|uniref:hypothetical protein n=1 Tax=Klenkia terrae TaxID=1052259 RepID=UPI00361B0DFD
MASSTTLTPSRRRLRWLLPAVLLLAWLALSSVAGPYSGKLSEVQSNTQSEFLPADAESQRVAELSGGFSDSDAFPAYLLLESGTPLTQAQLADFGAFAASVPEVEVPVTGGPPSGSGTSWCPARSRSCPATTVWPPWRWCPSTPASCRPRCPTARAR